MFRPVFLYYFILFAITFLVFSPAVGHDFVYAWDDALYVSRNPLIRSLNWANLQEIFLTPANDLYSPLTVLSFALEYQCFGLAAWVYHFNNILLHAAVSGLIFLLAVNLGVTARGAFLAALLFAVHPIHVESVAWVSERKDGLYAFFYLLAVYQYVRYVKAGQRRHFYWSLAWGLLSMLAKPMAVSLPLVLLAFDWLLKRPVRWPALLKEKIPYFLYLLPLLWITASHLPWAKIRMSMPEGGLVWIWSFVFYVEKFINPFMLLPHYELPHPLVLSHPRYIGAILLFIVFLYSIFHFRKHRFYVFAWIYYFASVFVVLRLHNVVDSGNLSPVADRFMYLPSLGFCLWAGQVADDLLRDRKSVLRNLIPAALVILFFSLGVKTLLQTRIWQNEVTLWSYVIQKNPADPLAYIQRALGYSRIHKSDLAIADNTAAIRINPQYYVSVLSLEVARDGGPRDIDQTNDILLNNPYYVVAHRNRGKIYLTLEEYDLALKDFNEVLRINPHDTKIRSLRARIGQWKAGHAIDNKK